MKKLIVFIFALSLFACSKEDVQLNNFKFTSIRGGKDISNKGYLMLMWSDKSNNNWKVVVKNPDGGIRSSAIADFQEYSINNLAIDSTYTISIQGTKDTTQSGTFGARIASQGDVEIKP